MEAIQVNKIISARWDHREKFLLPLIVLLLAFIVLKDYFVPGIQIALGIMAAPFIFRIKNPGVYSYRYAIAAIVFISGFFFLHITVLLFLSVGCLLLYTAESQWGKIGLLPFVFLICISPALHYLVNVFTFPIRMELSRYAAQILNYAGFLVVNKGSYFIMPDGQSYSVDTVCIGLNMFNTGLSMVLLLVGFSEQSTKKSLNIASLALVFLSTVVLLIITNLLRIVALVYFRSEAGTAGHDIIGIASLVLYTLIPVYFLVTFLNRRFGREEKKGEKTRQISFRKNWLLTPGIVLVIFLTSGHVKSFLKDTIKDQKLFSLNLPGFSKELKQDGVAEFRKDNILIYIKPANKGFESDHPPAMCWQGYGFQLNDIEKASLNGFSMYRAVLKKDDVLQYTAWWYDNGSSKTISQWEWRFAKGEPYRIINITAASKTELDDLCKEFLNKKLF